MVRSDELESYIRELNNHKWEPRQIAVINLVAMGPGIGQQLIEIITAPTQADHIHDYVRIHCVDVLGKLELPEAFEPLINICNDPDHSLREYAALALSDLKDERAVDTLLALLKNDLDFNVREAAAWALRRFPLPMVLEALVEAFRDEAFGDDLVRESASDALITIGSSAIPYLTAGLQNPNPAIRSESQFALEAISRLGTNERLWERLSKEKSFWDRLSAITHLWNLDTLEVIPGLELALRDPEYSIRLTAVLALGRMADPRLRAILETAVKDEHELVSSTAQRLLNTSGKSNEV